MFLALEKGDFSKNSDILQLAEITLFSINRSADQATIRAVFFLICLSLRGIIISIVEKSKLLSIVKQENTNGKR